MPKLLLASLQCLALLGHDRLVANSARLANTKGLEMIYMAAECDLTVKKASALVVLALPDAKVGEMIAVSANAVHPICRNRPHVQKLLIVTDNVAVYHPPFPRPLEADHDRCQPDL